MKKTVLQFCFMFIASLATAADMSNSMELSRLYIIGDATPYQWNTGETPEMDRIAEGVFRWSGKLEGGREFKFLNARDFHKHIFGTSCRQSVSAGNTYTLTYVADWALDGSRDFKFVPSETADYTIYVDLNTMMMSVREQEEPVRLPATLYATGSALGGSTVALPLFGNAEYKATLQLIPGNIILQDTPEATAETAFYIPLFDGVDITFGTACSSSLTKSVSSCQRQGWSVSIPGTYTIYGIIEDANVYARRFRQYKELYIVGGCCPLGWNYWTDPQSIRFSPSATSPEEMVWEGTLKTNWGENREEPNKFKILTAQDWGSVSFHPYTADETIIGESCYRSTGGPDVKWTIPQSGYYRITLNTAKETLSGQLVSAVGYGIGEPSVTSIPDAARNEKFKIRVSSSSIVVTADSSAADVIVTSVDGALVCKGRVDRSQPFTSRRLTHGVYLVTVSTQCKRVLL